MKTILTKLRGNLSILPVAIPKPNHFQLLQHIPIEAAVLDEEGNYLFTNKYYLPDNEIATKIIGKNDNHYFQMLGLNVTYAERRKEYFSRAIKERKTIRFTENIFFPEKNRNLYYTRFYQPEFHDGDPRKIKHIYFFGKDITAIIHSQKELRQLSYSDKLTGLKNRNAFYEQLEQLTLESERGTITQLKALLFCDLDNFKLVNDTYGHDVGDLVLKEAAKRIRSCLRKSDLVFRLGGDEFTILIGNLKNELDAGKVAEKITYKISEPYMIGDQRINTISVSIGVVPFKSEKYQSDLLVKKADTAMYIAKKRGKNNFQFISEEMTQKALRRLKVEKTLRDIIDYNGFDEQFKLLYQPIVRRSSNDQYSILGAEALIRWNSPDLGLVPPDNFIQLSEEKGLMNEIGTWVLNQCCYDYHSLRNISRIPFYVSINVSAKQLKHQDTINRLKKILNELEIKPENLQLELTETSFLSYEENVMENIHELRRMGVKLAVDDFGVGFASLSYLQRLPVTTIKIDKTFIQEIGANSKANEFIRSIIVFGKSIGKDIIAEGVETQKQVDFLSAQDCNNYQGFLFSTPLPLEEFSELIRKDRFVPESSFQFA